MSRNNEKGAACALIAPSNTSNTAHKPCSPPKLTCSRGSLKHLSFLSWIRGWLLKAHCKCTDEKRELTRTRKKSSPDPVMSLISAGTCRLPSPAHDGKFICKKKKKQRKNKAVFIPASGPALYLICALHLICTAHGFVFRARPSCQH